MIIQEGKEFEDWFQLKQLLAKLILKDIREEWETGNIPSNSLNLRTPLQLKKRFIYQLGITMERADD